MVERAPEGLANGGPPDDFLMPPTVPALGALTRHSDGLEFVGKRWGSYELRSVIGHGASGIVFEAWQDHPGRRVAVKAIRHSMWSKSARRRFEHESRVLARLSHPNIAHVYDTSATSDPPYFVMELVEGIPLRQFVHQDEIDLARKLTLLVSICRAVEHAHKRGVIHRDLKPSNILVTPTGQPKILDFGIARLTDSDVETVTRQTNLGDLVGTIPYMSPEQCTGDPDTLDTRSDVYALGVLGYELLTGQLPYALPRMNIPGSIRIIQETPANSPAHIRRELSGDLSVILLKALTKDKAERYQSASSLADDLQRYLNNEPILARPQTTRYQVRKLIARHRVLFSIIVGALLAVSTLTVWVSVLYLRATAAEQDALEKEATATRVKDFMKEVFLAGEPDQAQGNDVSARELLERGLKRVDEELVDQPAVRAELLTTICEVLVSHGEHQLVVTALEHAYAEYVRVFGEGHQIVHDSRRVLAQAYAGLSRWPEAEALLKQELAYIESDHAASQADIAEALAQLGSVVRHRDLPEAEQLHRRALALRRAVYGDRHESVASSLIDLGVAVRGQNQGGPTGAQLKEAERYYRDALAIALELFGEQRLITAHAYTSLAVALNRQQRLAEAEDNYVAGLHIYEGMLSEEHPYIANSLRSLGANLIWQGRYVEAEEHLTRALRITRSRVGDSNVEVGNIAWRLGILYRQHLGNAAAAEPLHREAVAVFEQVYEPNHPRVEQAHVHLGITLQALGNYDEALRHYDTARRLCEQGNRDDCVEYNHHIASCLRNVGRAAETTELMRALLAYGEETAARQENRAHYEVEFALCLIALKEFAEAEDLATTAYNRLSEMLSEADLYFLLVNRYRQKLADALGALEAVYEATNRPELAAARAEELSQLRALPPAAPPSTLDD